MLSRSTSFSSRKYMPGDQYVVTGSAAIGGRFIDLGNDEIVQPLLSARENTMEPVNSRPSGYFDPTGLMPLRKAVAKRLAAQTGIEWTAEEIVITAGSNKALLYAALTVLKGGDEVIIIRPWQPEVPPLILALGAVPVFVDAQRPRYTPDVSSIRAAVTPRTRAIIIHSPNNPTGAVYNRTTLHNIGELAIELRIWIISDECYSSFVFTGFHRHESIVTVHPGVRSRTIIVNPRSKCLAMARFRLGYLAASAPIARAVGKLQSRAGTTPSPAVQEAALYHLKVTEGHVERETYNWLVSARDIGLHILSDLRDVAPPRADGAFFFYLDLNRLASALQADGRIGATNDIARRLLKETNVGCVAGDTFGDVNGLRLSFGSPPEAVAIGLKRIVQALNSLRLEEPQVRSHHTEDIDMNNSLRP